MQRTGGREKDGEGVRPCTVTRGGHFSKSGHALFHSASRTSPDFDLMGLNNLSTHFLLEPPELDPCCRGSWTCCQLITGQTSIQTRVQLGLRERIRQSRNQNPAAIAFSCFYDEAQFVSRSCCYHGYSLFTVVIHVYHKHPSNEMEKEEDFI